MEKGIKIDDQSYIGVCVNRNEEMLMSFFYFKTIIQFTLISISRYFHSSLVSSQYNQSTFKKCIFIKRFFGCDKFAIKKEKNRKKMLNIYEI